VLRVAADSNIYVSVLSAGRGNPYEFLGMARTRKIRLGVSDAILDEVADVMARKFDWPPEDIDEAKRQIERFSEKVRPSVFLEVVKGDPDDDRILECASTAGSDYIVSGDKHLLRFSPYDSIRILNVAIF
jgi:putative PIN family toxin of toxin-antitoxin system